jgi:uncharacterized protein with PIN domain
MKPQQLLSLLILLAACQTITAAPQEIDTAKLKSYYYEVNSFVEDNEACLKCHGELKFTLYDSVSGRTIAEQMCPNRLIDRDEFYSAQHKSFSCTDCHSYDYNEFPHKIQTRAEEQLQCMDCHGYDETFAHYHFEEIEAEVQESIHNSDFTCWKCHNPHSYKAFMRNADDLEEAVLYDNNMCLRCHSNFNRFMLLSDRDEINILETHEWLPNQEDHFRNIRCIECHTEINDSILIAHKILPKEQAVENCTECHSRDSRLLHTLYKFQSQKERDAGLINGVILNNSFVIGANQNVFLNWLSFIFFGLLLVAISIHIILRIKS